MGSAADLDFSGKVIVVTGGSKGIGAGIAEAFALAGASVVILDRLATEGAETAARIRALGAGDCSNLTGDVADFDFLRGAIADAAGGHDRLDVLVNNAAFFPGWQAIDSVSDETLLRALRTNIGAYVVGCQAALPYLRQVGGSVINIGSLSGELGGWHDALYSSTKGAILSFTKALAIEEAGNGVRINAILPGNIVTEARHRTVHASRDPQVTHDTLEAWQWMGRSGTVREVGDAALFLASPMASFSTGTSFVVSGGLELGYGLKQPYPHLEPIQE